MKIVLSIIFIISFSFSAFGEKKVSKKSAKKKVTSIEKAPKSIFLIKKAKINSGVGEPRFYPAEVQLRTVINDKLLHSIKKFE